MIKVMSFNIRYGLANDGINHWQYRKSLTLARIKHFQPDLLGLQECRDDELQADFIREHLTDYQFCGVHRGGEGDTSVEMAPALFLKSSFKIVNQGCFWLSETPQIVGSKNWDADYPRTCTWLKLQHLSTKKQLVFLNTHFDYQPIAIIESAHILQQWITENIANRALIITGDFNATKDSQAYQELIHSGQLFDTRSNSDNTFHEFGKLNTGWSIDWILASSHFVTLNTHIDDYHEGDLYPSDHYPLTATLDWKARVSMPFANKAK